MRNPGAICMRYRESRRGDESEQGRETRRRWVVPGAALIRSPRLPGAHSTARYRSGVAKPLFRTHGHRAGDTAPGSESSRQSTKAAAPGQRKSIASQLKERPVAGARAASAASPAPIERETRIISSPAATGAGKKRAISALAR